MNKPTQTGRRAIRRNALAVALAVSLGLSGGVAFGQATTGRIFGQAGSSATVNVVNESGLSRDVKVGSDGVYALRALPIGTYTVQLKKDGAVVATRTVIVTPGAGTQVNFAGAQKLEAMEVTASALPPIDVSSVSTSTTITARELRQLPIQHTAEAVALLAPGTVSGSNYFHNAVSFGGAGVTENAYYVNGFNTTEMYKYTGSSYQLPWGAIAQQQVFTGGYGAKYGRSDGGVINQVGKRGTNVWHFGVRFSWSPASLRAEGDNRYYRYWTKDDIPDPYVLDGGPNDVMDYDPAFPKRQGKLRDLNSDNSRWSTESTAYLGGPLIEDTLFFFIAGEYQETKVHAANVTYAGNGTSQFAKFHQTTWYAKLDWNINENNVFEYTRLQNDGIGNGGYGTLWNYSLEEKTETSLRHPLAYATNSVEANIFHYTGYVSDRATVSVMYGRMQRSKTPINPVGSDLPYIAGIFAQKQVVKGTGGPIFNNQSLLYVNVPSSTHTRQLRADFTYRVGDHLLQAGIDNVWYEAAGRAQRSSGPGYTWIYGVHAPDEAINTHLGVGDPGSKFIVTKYKIDFVTGMSAAQYGYYIQDTWDVTDNLLVKMGLRNDRYVNYNNAGKAFVDQTGQWSPRVGVSWDVFGDSSLKIYAHVGRYYLALPQGVAQRGATASTYTREYFTYDHVKPDGTPAGLEPVLAPDEVTRPGPVSANNEYGQPKDPRFVSALNLKAQFQDEFILGFDKMLGSSWVFGGKAIYRNVDTIIDDTCDMARVLTNEIKEMGLNPENYKVASPGCRLFNPGGDNVFLVKSNNGTNPIKVTAGPDDFGIVRGPRRQYYAVNLYLQHPFDGKWYGRIDYTFSRNWGNTEGQVRSDIGQNSASKSEGWDFWQLTQGAYGYLPNHHRHVLLLRGGYQITPEWLVSGTARVQSGAPQSCLGKWGPKPKDSSVNDPSGYGDDYHWCFGKIRAPGGEFNGTTPWTRQLNLHVQYQPAFADHNLTFALDVINALDEQAAIQSDPSLLGGNGTGKLNPTFHQGIFFQDPRYVRLSVSYRY